MKLICATTSLAGGLPAGALRDALDELDTTPVSTGIHDRDDGSGVWDVEGLFDCTPDVAGLALLARLHDAPDFTLVRVDDRDWVAQVRSELTPVTAGRFIVYGGHDRARIPPNLTGLEIEAAQAFGTGHHATTQGCLVALDLLVRQSISGRHVADIGGGTGVLAMAAASVWPAVAIAGDIDPVATETARANVAANGLSGRVRCVTAAGFHHPRLRGGAPYDLIFANILAGPLRRMAGDVAAHQRRGGIAILSGILTRQSAAVVAVYRSWDYRLWRAVSVGEWSTLILRR